MSKLDRFLMSKGLLSANLNFSAITLGRYHSDHRPIMLRESFHDYGPIPFRSFHYWFEIDGFEEMISKAWCESPAIEVNPMLKLMYKMKFLKKRICEWNGMRQSSKSKKSAYKKELHDLETIIDQGNATDDMLYKRMEIIKVIQEVDNMEATQKAKIKWAIDGDENTKYYHGILNKKRNQLAIRGVLKDGIWIENPNLVKEIKRAVWDCGVDKYPGPDGFTFGFIRRFWSLLEKDVVAAVKYFFTSDTFPKGCNASFIALIPKIPDAKMVKDFRPISLIRSLNKIIAKILANRFVGVLGDIVSEIQSAFVADRQILDGPFILNEVLQRGQWSNPNIDTLIYMSKCFQSASRLSINLSKSNLMGIAVSVEKVKEVTKNIGCGVLKTHFSFLGLKVGGVCLGSNHGMRLWKKWIGMDGKAGHASIWCDIIKKMDRLSTRGIDLVSMMQIKIGNGSNTSFWEETFASSFRRLPRSGVEFEEWRNMLESLDGVLLSPVEDRWKWVLNGSGVFTVALARQYIDNKRLPGTSSKSRWIKKVPIKVNIHAWKVSLNGLPTRWNISRRGMDISFILCPLCELAVETSKHLFFECAVVKDIFRKICNWWGVSNMEISSFDD
nr:RNA-directed DNA polymerase, eukaryota, reverse transcriptase zinc-binding domain protein [Tanacetum cinerariifolium]